MRVRVTAATAALLLAALTACGGGSDDKAASKPAAKESATKVDCNDESLSQAEWMESCSDEAGGAAGAGPEEGAGTGGDGKPQSLAWGKTAQTTGYQDPDEGGGNLDVTPTTIVYQAEAMGSESANGVFAIVTVKDAAVSDAAATENAPAAGGGWQWIAPDGQTISGDDGEAANITPEGFSGNVNVQPGAWSWRTVAFDISKAQKGGTLVYVDGLGEAFRWKAPAQDQGPDVAKLKKGMEGDY